MLTPWGEVSRYREGNERLPTIKTSVRMKIREYLSWMLHLESMKRLLNKALMVIGWNESIVLGLVVHLVPWRLSENLRSLLRWNSKTDYLDGLLVGFFIRFHFDYLQPVQNEPKTAARNFVVDTWDLFLNWWKQKLFTYPIKTQRFFQIRNQPWSEVRRGETTNSLDTRRHRQTNHL